MDDKDKLEYIEVELQILRRLNPRTKGLRSSDWDGYQERLDAILRLRTPIHINTLEKLSAEFGVPFFEQQASDLVCKFNDVVDRQS
jgi:hypothetical protein